MNSPMPAPDRAPERAPDETLTIRLDEPTRRAYARLAAATGEPPAALLARLAQASAAPLLRLVEARDRYAAPRYRDRRAGLGLVLTPACADVLLGEPARCPVIGPVEVRGARS